MGLSVWICWLDFPVKTDAAFENTYQLINKLPVTYLHVFPFSPRSGTPAATYPDQVAHDVCKRAMPPNARAWYCQKEIVL